MFVSSSYRKIDSLRIELDKPMYMPGEVVTGSVSLNIAKQVKIQGSKLKLLGEVYVRWEMLTRDEDKRTNKREIYFDFDTDFLNLPSESVLEAGSQLKCPFQYTLPQSLPSSFEFDFAYVRYMAYAEVALSNNDVMYSELVFNVINMLDLNSFHASIRSPVGISNSVQVSGCCSSGMVDYSISVPKGGYVPGETIPFSVNITNKNGSKCKDVNVKLISHITKIPVNGNKIAPEVHKRPIIEVSMPKGDVAANSTETWQGSLTVPSMAASMPANTCPILEINNFIQLDFDQETALVPIVIGFVPLKGDGQSSTPTAPTFQPSIKKYHFKTSDITPNIQHCTFIGADHNQIWSNLRTFRPNYPVYQFN